MKQSTFTAVYDACVLYPAPIRDLLMRLGTRGFFRARWTERIHEEWKRNLLLNRTNLTREQLDRTSALMDRSISDALVTGYEPLCEGLELPDPDDQHVLAAAIRCGADVIVTFNLKDFPEEVLAPFGVEALHPDEFISDLLDLDHAAVLQAALEHWKSLKNPPFTADQYLEMLLKHELTQIVQAVRPYLTFM